MKLASLPLQRREFITILGGAAAWPLAVNGVVVLADPSVVEQRQRIAELAPAGVAELVNSNVDTIIAWATPTVIAVRRATSTIPIVMVSIGDPVDPGWWLGWRDQAEILPA